MLKKTVASVAAFLPTLAFAHDWPHWANIHHHHHLHWQAPEIDGGATMLGLAILASALAFIKKKA